jgi:hypothetical protein
MPPQPNVPQVVKVEVMQFMAGSPVVNLLHFQYAGGPPTVANLNTFSGTVSAAWLAHAMTDLSDQLLLTEVISTDLTSPTSARGTFTGGGNGGASDEALSLNTAVVISHNISRRYRGGHPRTYLAGPVASDLLNARQWTAVNLAAWQTDWDAFVAAVTAAPIPGTTLIEYVNVSYRTGNAARVAPAVDFILSSTVKDRPGSQRRRMGAPI